MVNFVIVILNQIIIIFSYGNHSILQTNSSYNFCRYEPSFDLDYLNTSYIRFSIFENNIANFDVCLPCYISIPVTSSNVENSNIINNSQLENDCGILTYHSHNVNLNHCSFLKNGENPIVPLFYGSESSCYLILNEGYTNDTTNNAKSFQITNINYFINTKKCIKEFK
jgi:hypothetical protein